MVRASSDVIGCRRPTSGVFVCMLQTRVTLTTFPIATPRGRSSKFPRKGTSQFTVNLTSERNLTHFYASHCVIMIIKITGFSLIPCDLKIYAKVFASRMEKVIDSLFKEDQTGFIKGRNASDNMHRLCGLSPNPLCVFFT